MLLENYIFTLSKTIQLVMLCTLKVEKVKKNYSKQVNHT
jgi:hypothetical protein